ncbi:hypothetical protein ARALYDRAFT_891052 [Arabidopsis lyrata subsp. lyrata]|uniref:B box-type domain-containing protein n=1 Tax=Arabidopsis lyrata subsp. lyrata TaxID=81972 RepID=D7KK70_ARALL|nr:hypothetical protein ARALYDRAFT_891052 [Arabidopsis lyrata subsp. lyrata]
MSSNANTICYCCYRRKELNFYCSVCNFCICADCEAKRPLLTIKKNKKSMNICCLTFLEKLP